LPDEDAYRRKARSRARYLIGELAIDDDGLRRTVFKLQRDPAALEMDTDLDGDSADPPDREIDGDVIGVTVHHQRHPITHLDAARMENGGRLHHTLAQHRKGDGLLLKAQERGVRSLHCPLFNELPHAPHRHRSFVGLMSSGARLPGHCRDVRATLSSDQVRIHSLKRLSAATKLSRQ
jgi:hypothetical protein